MHLEVGDTVYLQTSDSYFTGDLYHLTLCITLTTWDHSPYNHSLAVVAGHV